MASFAQHAGQLFEELKSLNLNSPAAMERAGLLANDHDRRSRELVREFQAFLRRRQDDFEVADDTSDRLLMLLLDKRADDVIQNHRVGRGYGRGPAYLQRRDALPRHEVGAIRGVGALTASASSSG